MEFPVYFLFYIIIIVICMRGFFLGDRHRSRKSCPISVHSKDKGLQKIQHILKADIYHDTESLNLIQRVQQHTQSHLKDKDITIIVRRNGPPLHM